MNIDLMLHAAVWWSRGRCSCIWPRQMVTALPALFARIDAGWEISKALMAVWMGDFWEQRWRLDFVRFSWVVGASWHLGDHGSVTVASHRDRRGAAVAYLRTLAAGVLHESSVHECLKSSLAFRKPGMTAVSGRMARADGL